MHVASVFTCGNCCVLAVQSKLTKVCRSWGVWKQLNKAVDGTTEQPANWEDMLLGECSNRGRRATATACPTILKHPL